MGKVIFELSGVPGCGKTTLVDCFTKSFSQCEVLSDYQFYRKQHKYLNKVRTILFWLMCGDYRIKKILAQMRTECIQREYWGQHFKKQLNYIRCICLYRKFGTDFNIAISEGMFQALLELMDTVEKNKESIAIGYCAELFHLFRKEFPYVKIAALKLDYRKANFRINHRKDTHNSVDNLGEEKRVELLEKRCRNMEALLNEVNADETKIYIIYADKDFNDIYSSLTEFVVGMGGYSAS